LAGCGHPAAIVPLDRAAGDLPLMTSPVDSLRGGAGHENGHPL